DTGLCLLNDPRHHALHFFNHIEYDSLTLADEYFRDLGAGRNIHLPKNYFPGDCETRPPANQWRSHAHLLFANWLYWIFQTVPADTTKVGSDRVFPPITGILKSSENPFRYGESFLRQ
ncbi:hypothetical protein EWM60_14455, partial [Candidatus Erwinia dacicola]|nr:hypothetical protein [Candidatus Erwinia dacicola]